MFINNLQPSLNHCLSFSRYICFLVFILLSPLTLAAEIFVLPDRNPVGMGGEFTLVFSTTEQPDGNPDFSPLRKDFEVVGTATSNNLQIINGVVNKEIAWRVRLYPKAAGTLPIPPIKFGSQSSLATQITVNKNGVADGLPRDGVMVELEAETPNPYVQQQFVVTQRMLHSVDLHRGGASMSHPEVSTGKALIQQLGKVINSTQNRKGIRYKVSERRYAIFPQTSGTLTFSPTVFQGIINVTGANQQRDPFGLMRGQQIRRFSEPLTLEVKPQPADVQGTWLPANSVSLNIYWETPADQFKTGEPVSLTVAVIADGLMAEQLPEIKLLPPQGIKGYSNQPELRNDYQGGSLIGTRQEHWILIGTAPGEYTLPAISVEWWNLKTGQLESAFVAAQQITVTGEVPGGGTANSAGTLGLTGADETPTLPAVNTDAAPDEMMAGDAAETEQPVNYWLWLFGAGILLLILLGVLYRRRLRDKHSINSGLLSSSPTSLAQINYSEQLEHACRDNAAQKAYDALIDWTRIELQLMPPTMAQLRQEVPMSFRQQLDELSMVLYARQADEWQGTALWDEARRFCAEQRESEQEMPADDLLSLHPD